MKLVTCKTCNGDASHECPICHGLGHACVCICGAVPCLACEGTGEILSLEPCSGPEIGAALFANTPCSVAAGPDRVMVLYSGGAPVAMVIRSTSEAGAWVWGNETGPCGKSAALDEIVTGVQAISCMVEIKGLRYVVPLGNLDSLVYLAKAAQGGRVDAGAVREAFKVATGPSEFKALAGYALGGSWAYGAALEAIHASVVQ